ncbi:MAG: hypothetical protein K2M27_07860 [Muribaculaceae bacterium]|nr:hypothetical protein [Muribaculaceae bacterium]
MKRRIYYSLAMAVAFAFAGVAQASSGDATSELTAIQLANLRALPGEPESPVMMECHTSLIYDKASLTFYCGTCKYIQGKPGVEPMSECAVYPDSGGN